MSYCKSLRFPYKILHMDCFYSLEDMLAQYNVNGWQRGRTKYGNKFIPPESIGTGFIEVWGEASSHCFVDSNVIFCKDLVERYYFRERGIQISFIDEMTLSYYQNRNEISSANFGIYVYINNRPCPWFKRFPAKSAQKVSSFLILESFFEFNSIEIPSEWWDFAAITLNNSNNSIPELGALCKRMKMIDVPEAEFSSVFKKRVIEIFDLLSKYVQSQEKDRVRELSDRSIKSAGIAVRILNEEYKLPPDVESLAAMVGIDKKTLQKAFKKIVGKSVGEYIRAIRMEKALTLLGAPELSIEEISRRVGYFSKINFYNSFRKIFGCTPQEYRV